MVARNAGEIRVAGSQQRIDSRADMGYLPATIGHGAVFLAHYSGMDSGGNNASALPSPEQIFLHQAGEIL
jgi:hypothetical protein